VSLEQIIEAAVESIRHAVNVIVKAVLSIGGNGGQSRGDDDRMAVRGAAVLAIADGHQTVHDLLLAAEDAERVAAAHSFAYRAKVRRDAEVLLCSARSHPKGAEHLIKNQQDAVCARQSAQRGEELGRWYDAAGV